MGTLYYLLKFYINLKLLLKKYLKHTHTHKKTRQTRGARLSTSEKHSHFHHRKRRRGHIVQRSFTHSFCSFTYSLYDFGRVLNLPLTYHLSNGTINTQSYHENIKGYTVLNKGLFLLNSQLILVIIRKDIATHQNSFSGTSITHYSPTAV